MTNIQKSRTLKIRMGETIYLTSTENFENIFINGSKSGTDDKAFCEAIQRLASRIIKLGGTIDDVINDMKGIKGGQQYNDLGTQLLSVPDAIAKGLI